MADNKQLLPTAPIERWIMPSCIALRSDELVFSAVLDAEQGFVLDFDADRFVLGFDADRFVLDFDVDRFVLHFDVDRFVLDFDEDRFVHEFYEECGKFLCKRRLKSPHIMI